MLLEIENGVASVPSPSLIKSQLSRLRSYGPSSYATLSDSEGNYVQVAGGGVTCVIEKRDASSGEQFRAVKSEKSKIFTESTKLFFGGGSLDVNPDEWFTHSEAVSIFLEFFNRKLNHDNWRKLELIPD